MQTKNVALASPEEVLEHTGCTIGSVPPFANIFGLQVYMDNGLLDRETIVFSAGTHTDSIIMKPSDYVNIVKPLIVECKKEN